jgi:hypothetical protein
MNHVKWHVPWCRVGACSTHSTDGRTEKVHPCDLDVLRKRVVVRIDEGGEFVSVVQEDTLGLALLDLHLLCGVARHSEM